MKKISDRRFKKLEEIVGKISEAIDKGESTLGLYPSLYLHASAVVDDGRAK